MDYPLVSCIVTSYNKIEYLYEAIDSVLNQDYPRIELLLTDDCSSDFDTNKFEEYINTNKRDNIVRYILNKQEKNVGTVKNINSMIKLAKGDFFIGIDGDDVFYDNHVVSKIIKRFQESNADFLACSRLKCTENLIPIGLFPTEEQRTTFSNCSTWEEQVGAFSTFNFLEIDAHVFSKKVVDELGLYDERFRQWQDGPRLTEYVMRGHTITPAFDIVYIKYRQGGVSNNPNNNKTSSNYLQQDKHTFIELYMIPNKQYCDTQEFRQTMFWYENEKRRTIIKRIPIALKYPKETLALIMNKLF